LKQRILFIINPIAGISRRSRVPMMLRKYLDHSLYDYSIVYTEHRGHATELAQNAVEDGYDIVAVAGGDGSVNEVATGLIGSECSLAILPYGSGNGLARHLGYPMHLKKAIEVINKGHSKKMDVGQINDKYFFSLIGIGFDAFVAKVFDREKLRGLLTYATISIRSLSQFKGYGFTLKSDGLKIDGTGFIINVCNSSQYGFNIKIAPHASITDGVLNVAIIRDLPKWKAVLLVLKVIFGWHENSKEIENIYIQKAEITTDRPAYLQIDGETVHKAKVFNIEIHPNALKVIVNQ